MATKLDKLKYDLYLLRRKLLYKYGMKKGLIRPYDKETLESLRSVYYGGVPASVILVLENYCNGNCYDRALLMTFGFGDDDFNLVDADIDGITLQPEYVDQFKNLGIKHYGNHCFAERTMKDGTTWVYDTSAALCFDKELYYKIERPKITQKHNKDSVINYIEYHDIKNANIENDKNALPLIMPMIELSMDQCFPIYSEYLKEEIEKFKKDIDYDGICKKLEQDMVMKGFYKKNKPIH